MAPNYGNNSGEPVDPDNDNDPRNPDPATDAPPFYPGGGLEDDDSVDATYDDDDEADLPINRNGSNEQTGGQTS